MKKLFIILSIPLIGLLFFNGVTNDIHKNKVIIKVGNKHKIKNLHMAAKIYQQYVKRTDRIFRSFVFVLEDAVYNDSEVEWNIDSPAAEMSEVSIRIQPRKGLERVSFVGNGDNFFLKLRNRKARAIRSNIFITNLDILNYTSGIHLNDWKAKGQLTHNTIRNMKFENIGEMFPYRNYSYRNISFDNVLYRGKKALSFIKKKGVVSIGITKSSNNLIVNNRFIKNINLEIDSYEKQAVEAIIKHYDLHSSRSTTYKNQDLKKIRNNLKRYGPLLFHSIYISDGSSRNTIQYNKFAQISGDPVRIRNFSNNNHIIYNRFDRPFISKNRIQSMSPSSKQYYPVSEWYCNTGASPCYSKSKENEDYSYGTVVAKNLTFGYDRVFINQTKRLEDLGSQSSIAMCERSGTCQDTSQPRVKTYHNINNPKNGLCYIKFKSPCQKLKIYNRERVFLDYLSQTSHESEKSCANRVQSYKKWCSESYNDIDYIYRSF